MTSYGNLPPRYEVDRLELTAVDLDEHMVALLRAERDRTPGATAQDVSDALALENIIIPADLVAAVLAR